VADAGWGREVAAGRVSGPDSGVWAGVGRTLMRVPFGCAGWSVGETGVGRRRGTFPAIPAASPDQLPTVFVTVGIWPVDRAVHLGEETIRIRGRSTARVPGINQIMAKWMVKSSRCAGHRPEPSSSSGSAPLSSTTTWLAASAAGIRASPTVAARPRSRSTSPHSAPETTGGTRAVDLPRIRTVSGDDEPGPRG